MSEQTIKQQEEYIKDELEFENALIKQLTEGDSQWSYRPDIRTEDDLWNNIREKLNHNNLDALQGQLLTDKEFEQVKNQMSFASFYDAGKWLVGENGSVKVSVQRDDALLGKVYLEVINHRNIAGGTSSYEVINQLKISKRNKMNQNRRSDVTLLLNGLPLIHLELKAYSVDINEAFNQIDKYIEENVFTGPLSMIQIFIGMNARRAQYIAAPQNGKKINRKFLTEWIDDDNNAVKNGLIFAKEVLSIPQAHHMIADYMVLDEQRKSLIVLRPYQIRAIQQVQKALARKESGYIWHTTGSGKTLTSYKVARNLVKFASVDKVVFLVDRKDLDNQTFSAFDTYSENDLLNVLSSDNTRILIQQLLSDDKDLIVTTRQKFDALMKAVENDKLSETKAQKIRDRKVAFVVDECHRTISAERQRMLKKFFKESLWYGFTGTPIFEENKKNVKGNLEATTEEQYGKCLHRYTVKEAIHDNAVLGFKVDYQTTLSEEDINEILISVGEDKLVNSDDLVQREQAIPRQYFEDDQHKLKVIDAIINKSRKPLGFYNKNPYLYEGLLTTASINDAQRYYELFQEVKSGKHKVKVKNNVHDDFPKVAITYSVTENEDTSQENQEKLKLALADYNQMFGTNYDLETLGAYNNDLNNRLARKQNRYLKRSEQLDLVIVVDRLLTGFDAPCMSTLFIDREPMTPQDLIQAFSRTNRIFDENKTWGNIKTFRRPNLFKQHVDNAFQLYSSGGETSVLAPTWEQSKAKFNEAVDNLLSIVSTPQEAMALQYEADQIRFIKAYQKLNSSLAHLVVYDEFDSEEIDNELIGITIKEIDKYETPYLNLMEELRKNSSDDDEVEQIDLDYELSSVNSSEINYDYLLYLMKNIVDKSQENKSKELIDDKTKEEVNDYLQELSKDKPYVAQYMQKLWKDILDNPTQYVGQDIKHVLLSQLKEKEDEYITKFADKWCLSYDDVKQTVKYGEFESDKRSAEIKNLAKKAVENYKQAHQDENIKTLKLKRQFKEELDQLVKVDLDSLEY